MKRLRPGSEVLQRFSWASLEYPHFVELINQVLTKEDVLEVINQDTEIRLYLNCDTLVYIAKSILEESRIFVQITRRNKFEFQLIDPQHLKFWSQSNGDTC